VESSEHPSEVRGLNKRSCKNPNGLDQGKVSPMVKHGKGNATGDRTLCELVRFDGWTKEGFLPQDLSLELRTCKSC
jgi:hypothetical protein